MSNCPFGGLVVPVLFLATVAVVARRYSILFEATPRTTKTNAMTITNDPGQLEMSLRYVKPTQIPCKKTGVGRHQQLMSGS